jgi:hypothetical protein
MLVGLDRASASMLWVIRVKNSRQTLSAHLAAQPISWTSRAHGSALNSDLVVPPGQSDPLQ